MSTGMIIAYGGFCLIVFFIINRIALRNKDNNSKIDQRKETVQKEEFTKIEKTEEVKKKPVTTESNEKQSFSMGKVLTVLLLGMFVSILNQTLINVALPKLMADFNVTTSTAQWLSTGFMLVNGILIPVSAYLVETFTYRKLFIFSMIAFTVGSIICALSGNFPIMMVGRVVQAVGAGILMPLGMNIFMTIFPPEKRGAAMGLMGIAMILAPAIGPTITGYVVQDYSWHFLFYGMAVFGVIAIILANAWFRISRKRSFPTLDILGVLSSSLGFGSLLYGFSEAGNEGWGSTEVVLSLVIAFISLGLFVWRELTAKQPLINLKVFKSFSFSYTLLINLIVTTALYGGMILLPLYLQNIRGFTPIKAGLLLLPGSLIMGALGPLTGKLFDKYGIRPLAIFGLLIMTFTTYEFTKLSIDTPYLKIMFFYTLRSFGMSFIMMPIMTAGLNKLPVKMITHGTATQNTLRQVAGSVGTAILVTIMTTQTTNHLADFSNEVTSTNSFIMDWVHHTGAQLAGAAGLSSAQGGALAVTTLYSQASKLASISGINDAFIFATALSGIALVLSFFMGSTKSRKFAQPKSKNQNKQSSETIAS
ncbi:DHA2 family efflux MFS transporter permease subunit [Gottfriedia sp. NPDC056225]|uniref:DHA2 family efflux MFS transporter permease subunit n=1 Tax=Gottfriedia sp. NPDC056225 TaxID=3345751 RepID=UPI0015593F1E|nr:DHA2 family efflux MFS transporter permease subunit [Arthrobacter citreus]